MTSKKQFLTLIELVMALSLLLLVLLPVSMATTMAIKDWGRSRDIRMLQEDLHLASLTIKGIIEEASGVKNASTDADWEEGTSTDSITLELKEPELENPKTVTIKHKQYNGEYYLKIGEKFGTPNSGSDIQIPLVDPDSTESKLNPEFTSYKEKAIRVKLTVKNGELTQRNEFIVKMRNFRE